MSPMVKGFVAAMAAFVSTSAHATFHLMQIEQVIGGVNGDTSAQAIQLRMRAGGQNFVSEARLFARDATGANPVLLIDIDSDVTNAVLGSRVLIVTKAMLPYLDPSITPDFVMDTPIPASYLAAGSLTFEDDLGPVVWRLCWGGAGYTGPTNMPTFNDANGNCAPPIPGALPSATLQAIRFTGAAGAGSTTNAADYAVTTGAATFTNNANQGGVVTPPAIDCPADIASRGSSANVIDIDDLLAVIGAWGPCPKPPTACAADIVNAGASAGIVDIDDLLGVIGAWGPCP